MRRKTFLVCSAVALLTLGACSRSGTNAPTTDTSTPAATPAGSEIATTPGAAAPGAATAPAPAASAPGPASTQGFVTTAAISDMYEIAAARIALKQTKNEAVKAFAAKMIRDHSATTAAIKTIIADGQAAVTAPDAMDVAHKTMIAALDQAGAAGFDKTYLDQQVSAHNDAVALFKTYSAQGDNPALKAFAKATEPKIEQHLNMAQKLDSTATMSPGGG